MLLCTKHTTMPSTIPQGKHVISVSKSQWFLVEKNRYIPLYTCSNGFCIQQSSSVDYSHYSDVRGSCLIIKNGQEREQYLLTTSFYPSIVMTDTSVYFLVTNKGVCLCVRVCVFVCVCVCVCVRACVRACVQPRSPIGYYT